jgi:hypothetical protein
MKFAQFNRILLSSVAVLVSMATSSRAELAPDAQQAVNNGPGPWQSNALPFKNP